MPLPVFNLLIVLSCNSDTISYILLRKSFTLSQLFQVTSQIFSPPINNSLLIA
uniref:Uncharacterized protein n=1 Tax=Myoviridae sp. ctHP32 TaxID=2823539 RepID=A0A8S5LFV7_9CAUD|nr:MAG TPA: hypothetical protein [Myoviridae sp. ctHP32]